MLCTCCSGAQDSGSNLTLLMSTLFFQPYIILCVAPGSVILALLLAGYLGQQYLPPPKPRVIGLDLGTTFCSVGVFQPGTGEIEIIEDDKGRKSIPSVVSFTLSGVFSGHEGQELSDINPQNTIYDAKRFIGKIFDEETLEKESARYPFKVHSFHLIHSFITLALLVMSLTLSLLFCR